MPTTLEEMHLGDADYSELLRLANKLQLKAKRFIKCHFEIKAGDILPITLLAVDQYTRSLK